MTIILIALNVLMFLLESLAGGSEDIRVALRFGAYYAPYVLGDGEWYRLFTSVFLHFGPEHLGSNMLSLYVLGSFVEQYFGRIRYLVIYLVSGLCGNLLVMGIDIARWNAAGLSALGPAAAVNTSVYGSFRVSAGASGAICGLLGVFLVFALMPRMKRLFPMRRVLISVLLVLAPGFSDRSISMTAHIGGLIGGFLITLLICFLRAGAGQKGALQQNGPDD